jgi:hypothetical protein
MLHSLPDPAYPFPADLPAFLTRQPINIIRHLCHLFFYLDTESAYANNGRPHKIPPFLQEALLRPLSRAWAILNQL